MDGPRMSMSQESLTHADLMPKALLTSSGIDRVGRIFNDLEKATVRAQELESELI